MHNMKIQEKFERRIKMFLEDYKKMVSKILENEEPEDRMSMLDFFDERVRYMADYVQAVCDHSMGTNRAYAMMQGGVLDPENYRERVMALDRNRKIKHDVAMDGMNQINRLCDMYKMPHICPDSSDRYVKANFCAAVTNELFMSGTARDEKTIEAVTKVFSGDTAALDEVVRRVEKGEKIKLEGRKLWESLR